MYSKFVHPIRYYALLMDRLSSRVYAGSSAGFASAPSSVRVGGAPLHSISIFKFRLPISTGMFLSSRWFCVQLSPATRAWVRRFLRLQSKIPPIETMTAAKIPRPTPKPIASEYGPVLLGATDAVGDDVVVADTLEETDPWSEATSEEEVVVGRADSVAIENAGSANAVIVYIAASTVKIRSGMLQHVGFVCPSLHSSRMTSPVLQHHLFSSL
jgi:hypothetical protein